MKLENLICLTLQAEKTYLEGLALMPKWLAFMDNLTSLGLFYSNLSENPTSVLQHLPKLKELTLWEAYNTKLIGKEFCGAEGFSKLEILKITSEVLVEWTEIVNELFQI
ncbi:conserved hypothetical protein [Ricinus communis]|uniref:Uncharacterized protein n=1 Tax=Ricinus communis TaxID=3988 RepID=B9SGE2_RICCO|nr:conserved hypothetical protein [Ricinus communis]